ncbi:hypothetical protein C6A87_006175 [Mycobacterium sp. ITM-2016-00317]|uniref:hypothetical protein n=1 Tax=Mycobacterium sp. ITM-2016-00317 TaxID=2099694 RepID=UPI00287F9F8B|nr:hypothetical protein [Mycobacterium sp. ITM-2016-00317]WNG88808.1 hypothetical protein C6A87_006175 [Mycobacterium sp. ITM-2016-00317]
MSAPSHDPAEDPDNEATERQRWLSAVTEDPRTGTQHHAAAEVIAHQPCVPREHISAAEELVQMGLAWRNELDGELSYTPIDPAGKPA